MKTLKYMMVATALQAACMAVADMIPGDWRVDVGKRSVFRKEIYQGESVRLEATFFRDGKEFTPDFAAPMLYWQTNGMGRSYFSAPAVVSSNAVCAVWDGSKDCGARYYHGFIGETGVTYRAEFEFKMAPSPGFRPNALPLPVEKLDFAAMEIANAPWYTKAETDNKLAVYATAGEVAHVRDIAEDAQETAAGAAADVEFARQAASLAAAAATNYTDEAVTAAESRILSAESDPTVPAWAKNSVPPTTSLEPATNYTDSAVAAIREYCDLYVRNTNCWMIVSNGVFSVYSVSGDAHVKVWEWDATSSNRFAALADQTAAATNALSRRIDAAPARWSDFAADGTANPYTNAVWINKTAVFGDGSVLWEGTNGFFALSAAAPICAGGTSAAFRIGTDADTFFGMEVAASYLVGILTGGISVTPDSSAVTLTYMWDDSYTNAPPAVYYAATLADEFRDISEVADLSRADASSPGVSYSVTVSGLTGSQGFFTAKREVQGGAVMRSTLPIFADGYYIAPSNAAPQIVQPDSVFTISTGGHTYRVFGERID